MNAGLMIVLRRREEERERKRQKAFLENSPVRLSSQIRRRFHGEEVYCAASPYIAKNSLSGGIARTKTSPFNLCIDDSEAPYVALKYSGYQKGLYLCLLNKRGKD